MADNKPIVTDENELNINIDQYSKPSFNPELQQDVAITEGYNYLDAPSNLDLLQIDLIDEYDNTVTSIQRHISQIEGIKYEAEQLRIDTFDILTKMFNKVSGRYTFKISGYRNYIHNDIEDLTTADENDGLEPDEDGVTPLDIEFDSLSIVELSRSRKEVRVKANNQSAKSFEEFGEKQAPGTIPFKGRYWKYEDKTAVPGNSMFYSPDGRIDPKTSKQFSSDAAYDNHREERGLPFGPENDNRWNGNVKVDSNHIPVGWMRNTPEGRRLESTEDIWPVTLRVLKPGGGFVEMIAINWMEHKYTPKAVEGEDDPESFDTIIFRLATPAPKGISADVSTQVLRPLFIPFVLPVEIDVPYIIDEAYEELRGPNLRLEINKNSSKGTITKNEEELVGTTDGISQRLEKSIISGSGLITTNVDYRDYSKFVHFSSATERLKNFQYKLTRIEHYASKSIALGAGFDGSDGSVTGSANIIANKLEYDNLRKGILNSFNPYEQYLYYTSHSAEVEYTTDGIKNISPATWPKSLNTKTGVGYNLFSVTSSEAQDWYSGRLVSASIWDEQNQSALRNVIPTHIRVDDESESYQLFFDMVGEHFDDVYLQVQSLEEQYRRDESVDVGLSKDLLFDVAKSFGWDLYPGHSTTELWEYALGTSSDGEYQASGSGITQTYVVKESHSSEDIEKQTWKRLLNNLPLLLKTKGTARGIRALLSSYGVPLTILNIDEYGGAPVARADDKRAIEKFSYGLNASGSNMITTRHGHFKQPYGGGGTADSLTTEGLDYRSPSMYEIRVDTSVQQSMYIARSAQSPGVGPEWEVRMEHSSSAAGWDTEAAISAGSASVYAQYGRFVFEISSSAAQPAISASTDYMPLFDNDWWNISFGVSEHPYKKEGSHCPESQSFIIRAAKASEHAQGKITHQSSGLVVGNSSSYSAVWGNATYAYWLNRHTDPTPGIESFSGSVQEIRGWAEYLSDDVFHQHTLSPTSIVGDSVEMGYNDLLLRLPLGTDNKTYNHSDIITVTSSLPNTNNLTPFYSGDGEGGLFSNFIDENNYSPKSETYFVKVPHTAGPSKHSNKIRIEDNTLRGNQLSRDKSFEQSSFDSNPLDSEDVSVVLSPADMIDTDISMQFGGFDLDDYIGDPRDRFKHEYTALRDTKRLYFKKYEQGNSVMAFIQYLRSFNKGLFKQIEEMIPARADAIVGIEIRPNLLERHKIGQPISASREIQYHTSSIAVYTSSLIPAEVVNTQTYNGSEYGTLTATIGIGAPPSQQRSGSNDYYNLYRGATYLRDVFGETTESAKQVVVLDAPATTIENRIQIPTYNNFNKPDYGVDATGSGWITVFEDNFETFTQIQSPPSTGGSSHVWSPSDIGDRWRKMTGGGTAAITGVGLTIGDNSGNDLWWGQWDNPFAYEPNTLYRMSITLSQSVDTDNDNKIYAGFAHFIENVDDNGLVTLTQVSNATGNKGHSSSDYFVGSGVNVVERVGLGNDLTLKACLGNVRTRGGTQNTNSTYPQRITHNIKLTDTPRKGTYAPQKFTHFAPMFIVNYNNDDGIVCVKNIKVEALPRAFVDVHPQYDTSPAQRRLVIDGTRMTSPDWNVGSAETIDGGPVAEYQLVNPNIVQVAPAPGRPIPAGVGPSGPTVATNNSAIGNVQQAQNNNLTVR